MSHPTEHTAVGGRPGWPSRVAFAIAVAVSVQIAAAQTRSETTGTPPPQAQEDPEVAKLQAERQKKRLELERVRRGRGSLSESQLLERLEQEKRLLDALVRLSIELGESSQAFEQGRQRVEAELSRIEAEREQREQAREEERKQRQRAATLGAAADHARRRGDFTEARRLIADGRKLDPESPELAQKEAWIERDAAEQWVTRLITWSVLGVVLLGVAVVAFLAWRGRSRVRTLEMTDGPSPGEVLRLEKDSTLIGALDSEVDWAIVDLSRRISRQHCEIARAGRHYFLVDLSRNGTNINGRPVPHREAVRLRPGDLIALSDDVVLRFE